MAGTVEMFARWGSAVAEKQLIICSCIELYNCAPKLAASGCRVFAYFGLRCFTASEFQTGGFNYGFRRRRNLFATPLHQPGRSTNRAPARCAFLRPGPLSSGCRGIAPSVDLSLYRAGRRLEPFARPRITFGHSLPQSVTARNGDFSCRCLLMLPMGWVRCCLRAKDCFTRWRLAPVRSRLTEVWWCF